MTLFGKSYACTSHTEDNSKMKITSTLNFLQGFYIKNNLNMNFSRIEKAERMVTSAGFWVSSGYLGFYFSVCFISLHGPMMTSVLSASLTAAHVLWLVRMESLSTAHNQYTNGERNPVNNFSPSLPKYILEPFLKCNYKDFYLFNLFRKTNLP